MKLPEKNGQKSLFSLMLYDLFLEKEAVFPREEMVMQE